MTPEHANGGEPDAHRTAPASCTDPSQRVCADRTRQDRQRDLVAAVAVPPVGRRHLWMLWVPACPHCGLAHRHVAAGPVGGVREPTCGGPTYSVQIPREQRRGGAA